MQTYLGMQICGTDFFQDQNWFRNNQLDYTKTCETNVSLAVVMKKLIEPIPHDVSSDTYTTKQKMAMVRLLDFYGQSAQKGLRW